jgi:hypothetical protein
VTPRGRPVSGVVLAVQAFVAMDEPQRSRVDAIAEPVLIRRTIGEDVAEMAVTMRRTNLGAGHTVAGVLQFLTLVGSIGLGSLASRIPIQICLTKRTVALPIRCRRRCPVPCYPDIRQFWDARCRPPRSRDTVQASDWQWPRGSCDNLPSAHRSLALCRLLCREICATSNVRFWHIADVPLVLTNVRSLG